MQDEMMGAHSGHLLAASDSAGDEPIPGGSDGAGNNDALTSDAEQTDLTDEDIDMFEDDPTIPTE